MWLDLGKRIYLHLDSLNVKWTSIDPVCFAPVRFTEEGEDQISPLHLWVGVTPGSLLFEAAKAAAEGCKDILAQAGFPDIEVAFRESVVTWSAGTKFLDVDTIPINPISDLRSPFTPTLGIHISPLKTPHYEGTGAIYIRESSTSHRIFLLTARHVVLPTSKHPNRPYLRNNTSQPHEQVIILSNKAYNEATTHIKTTIGDQQLEIEIYKARLEKLGLAVEGEASEETQLREEYERLVVKAEQTIKAATMLLDEAEKHWTCPNQRMLGYILHAPPIDMGVGHEQFTQDWGLVELYNNKINWATFPGNKIYLGHTISPADFIRKMNPHPQGQSRFRYPTDGMLQIKSIVKDNEIRHSMELDSNGENCFLVVKNGASTGVTIGRATGIKSFVRHNNDYGIEKTSIEIAVYSYNKKDGAFSAPGDSGSIVVDGEGRIVGLLTAGASRTSTESTDVSYLTPYWWIEEQIKKEFPESYLYEIAAN
ncbi:hypothetical protein D9758_007489 [Tetrapyrgos nigripes]|uniref:Uncharacterized protein n=1 Tax=Tetrapyrgos nigripes TaxID=182062 RepID=A0A8H5G3N8_9AGAR|nr:hypothetical protein D9758_007489 [Tetrapyrgos nigripes]